MPRRNAHLQLLHTAGLVLGSQSGVGCYAVFLAGMPEGPLTPHQLLRSIRPRDNSAGSAEGSGAAGITQQSIPQVTVICCSS